MSPLSLPTGGSRPIGAPIGALIGRDQHGILSREQLLAVGVTKKTILWSVRSSRWQPIHPGVYCTYTGPLTWESRIWAALLHAGDGAVLDGPTAVTLHGLRG